MQQHRSGIVSYDESPSLVPTRTIDRLPPSSGNGDIAYNQFSTPEIAARSISSVVVAVAEPAQEDYSSPISQNISSELPQGIRQKSRPSLTTWRFILMGGDTILLGTILFVLFLL